MAYSGSFWVDQESLDLVRLEMHAEDIPADLDCSEAHQSVTYGRLRLGAGERLLPSSAELVLINREGHASRNTISYNKCRQYTASSSMSFTTPPDLSAPTGTRSLRSLPADVVLNLRLDQPTSLGESAAGDQIMARLDKALTSGTLFLPKGTRVLGRIRRLEQHARSPASILVGLQFFAAEAPDGRITFRAHLTGPRAIPNEVKVVNNRFEGMPGLPGLDIEDDGTKTGVASFRISGKELHIDRGFRTLWKAQ
jgi:hypothetical protein